MAEKRKSHYRKNGFTLYRTSTGDDKILNYLRAFYYLNALNKQAFWHPRKLEEYQIKKLQSVIRYAYDKVPFYNKRMKESGIRPEEIKSKDDLNKIPIIRKAEIRENLDEIISKDFDVKSLRMMSTSGSTGEPLFIYLCSREMEFRKAKHLRANISCGQKALDRWITLTGPQHFGKTTRLQRLFRFYVPTAISVFDDISTQISKIERFKPDVLDGYSSSLFLLAKEIEKQKVETIKPRFIIGGAELIDRYSREYIEKVFGVNFFDQYSSVEFERMAWQCHERNGYHIDADALILQFLDKNGEEVSSGESGEIVCTSLFNYSMPLIRYAVGDVGTPSGETCECGRTLPLMQMVEGRKDSLLLLPICRILTPRAFTIALHEFKYYNCIEKFRIVQKKLDAFEFNIKMKNNGLKEDVLKTELSDHLKTIFKFDDLTFEINLVDDIALDKNGKLMAVVSELK
jgi:phenylacetate-CoA ligase